MIYDSNPVPVMYSDDELAEHVKGIISNLNLGDYISFKQICTQIIQKAEEEGKIKPNILYSSSEISPSDQERISAVMWELILDKKVFTVLGSYRWFGRSEEDTIFVVRKV